MTTISAHVLVKNEARFVWFSIQSIIDHVDRVQIYDTGSTDNTVKIIQSIKSDKIEFIQEFAKFSEEKARQKMLDNTKTDWFLVVDADEVWWNDSIKKVTSTIRTNGDEIESIVVPTINPVGDMYHYQEKAAGNYNLLGRIGHYNLRGVNTRIPGLHSQGEHGVWGWVDSDNKMIQDRDKKKIAYVDAPYLHMTFLQRAGKRAHDYNVLKRRQKLKHEIGIPFPLDYYYPESFFKPHPANMESVWEPMGKAFFAKSLVKTPLRKLKRRIMPKKVGY